MNGYSEDLKLLSPNGWININEVGCDTLIAQVDDDLTYTFVNPINLIKFSYSGILYSLRDFHGKIDVLSTPNQKVTYIQNKIIKFATLEGINRDYSKYLVRSARSNSYGKDLSFIDRMNIAFQADGSYQSKGSNIRFSFSKQRKIDRLENILKSNNILYKIYQLSDGRVEFNISINREKVFKHFKWVDIKMLCSSWCVEFIEELSHWDASIRNSNKITFCTTTKSVADIVELIAISAGYGCFLRISPDNRKAIYSDCYNLSILKNNKMTTQALDKKSLEYSGDLYSITVPSGKILTKRNKSTLVICDSSY